MHTNGLAHSDAEEFLMSGDATTQRLFIKLDEIQSTQATTAADVARIQGAQKGIEMAVEAVKEAIGNVTETKLEARETKTKMVSIERELAEIKKTMADQAARADMKSWVEPLVRWAVASLLAGGAIGAGNAIVQKVL